MSTSRTSLPRRLVRKTAGIGRNTQAVEWIALAVIALATLTVILLLQNDGSGIRTAHSNKKATPTMEANE